MGAESCTFRFIFHHNMTLAGSRLSTGPMASERANSSVVNIGKHVVNPRKSHRNPFFRRAWTTSGTGSVSELTAGSRSSWVFEQPRRKRERCRKIHMHRGSPRATSRYSIGRGGTPRNGTRRESTGTFFPQALQRKRSPTAPLPLRSANDPAHGNTGRAASKPGQTPVKLGGNHEKAPALGPKTSTQYPDGRKRFTSLNTERSGLRGKENPCPRLRGSREYVLQSAAGTALFLPARGRDHQIRISARALSWQKVTDAAAGQNSTAGRPPLA